MTALTDEKPAGFWRRMAAYGLDMVLLFASFMLLVVLDNMILGTAGTLFPTTDEGWNGLSMVTYWLYSAGFEASKWQGSVGKRIMGIRVTDMQGERIGFGRASGRHWAKLISGLAAGLGYLVIPFTQHKRGWHDMIADCRVVK